MKYIQDYHISASFHTISKINFRKFGKSFCKENFNVKLVKLYPIPNDLKSFLVYKFTCASSSSSYIGETCRHFKTKFEEHIKKDNKSHMFKNIYTPPQHALIYITFFFKKKKKIDKANSKFDLKIKEHLHINWKKPILKTQ